MSARERLHSDLLTTPMAALLPHPEGWASSRIERYRDEVRAEVLREAADAIAMDRDASLPSGGRGAWRRGMTRAIDLLHRMAGGLATPVEKASAPAPTATPVQSDVLDGEIQFVGYDPTTLTGWNVIELAPDYYGHVFMQIDGWLPEGHPTDCGPVGTAQMTYAHLHGHAIPRDLNVQVETKGYGGPRRFMKIQWRKDSTPSLAATPQPERGRARLDATSAANAEATHWRRLGVEPPAQSGEWAPAAALRDRLADLLTHIRRHPGRTWTTEDVRKFYLSQAPKRATCRRDLTALRAMGWLVEYDEPGRRFYRLNTRKDGAS
ncbi:hypothetical protein ACFRKB_11200 [Streptomyces scopuliridis]|uniref:hypothetical protein n=1 Tax=Streptomyces scopuliridis TaxID=452529 RepID=UPI00369284D4